MDRKNVLSEVAETGRLLLERGLVARTWGNFSARLADDRFAITPSGLGYEHMTAEDIVLCSVRDDSFEGTRKPSSEKGIHREAYRIFPEAGFVIHTHQKYATALSLGTPGQLSLTEEERQLLGGVAWAEYGLPGTKKLKNAVAAAFRTGAHTVLMKHHGTLIVGRDREDALQKASLLEDICRRSCKTDVPVPEKRDGSALLDRVREVLPNAALEDGDASRAWSALGLPVFAQLDDAAQMIGLSIPCASEEKAILRALKKHGSVFVPNLGALVCGEDAADTAALGVLTEKAATAALHTRALHIDARLGLFDCLLMRAVYLLKYSKKKRG